MPPQCRQLGIFRSSLVRVKTGSRGSNIIPNMAKVRNLINSNWQQGRGQLGCQIFIWICLCHLRLFQNSDKVIRRRLVFKKKKMSDVAAAMPLSLFHLAPMSARKPSSTLLLLLFLSLSWISFGLPGMHGKLVIIKGNGARRRKNSRGHERSGARRGRRIA